MKEKEKAKEIEENAKEHIKLVIKDFKEFIEIKKQKTKEQEQMIAFGKRCFYKGFDKAENDDANCFTAWREEVEELLTKQQ